MSLSEYQAKRRFDETPEPKGGSGKGPLRFVVQKHDASHLHYDFRLEMGGILKSWAIPKGPSLNPDDKRLAMMTEDHPYDYRTFEGIIPDGNYGAGTVMVWDEGTYEPLNATGDREADDKLARHGVHAEHLTFILKGSKLNGEFALIKMKGAEANAWLLVKAAKDKYAGELDVTQLDRSAVTGRSLEEIGGGAERKPPKVGDAPKAKLPGVVEPMLATLADAPFDREGWLYEIKWDGYRAVATVTADGVRLRSRRDQNFNEKYPAVVKALEAAGAEAVIDGEIVVLDDEGKSDFGSLQTYAEDGGNLAYCVFDILHLDGHDLTGLPLSRRKEILREWLPASDILKYSDHIEERGTDFFKLAEAQGLEGVMAKAASSKYLPGKRSQSWLKIKTHARQEAVIGGYTAPRGSRSGFGALVLGVYEGKDLKYIGHTGGGFDERSIASLLAKLEPLAQEHSPFADTFKLNAPVTWVKPELVCEVEFREWTSTGHMRQPIFLGLRPDKPATAVHREVAAAVPDVTRQPESQRGKPAHSKVSGRAPIHHPEKIYWPDSGFTKGQLAEYYQAVAPLILPYLRDRPESLNRFPGGIKGDSFFQKNFDDAPDWLPTHLVHSESEDRDINYALFNEVDALMYAVNLGCIELNPWNSRVGSLDKPDWCVIDLDPEDIGFEAVITVAQAVHEVLERAKISGYPKTSGASGIHIFIPLGAAYTYDHVKDFAHIIAQLVNAKVPDITSLERSPAKRQGKVYLDYLQNRRGQTLAAPYCVRPRPGMPVSAPLRWDEVKAGLSPAQFTVNTIHDRIREVGDLWAPVIGPGIDLRTALEGLS